jgi:transcription elongation factor GreA
MQDKNVSYVTAEGAAKIEQELKYLKSQKREEISARLKSAIEHGDLSENADYMSAKEDQGFLEGRIMELEHILKTAVIIEEMEKDKTVVSVGDTVTIQEDDYPEEVYYIVGPKEADPQNGRISYLSPIGKALMGNRAGANVVVEAPDGEIRYKILKID